MSRVASLRVLLIEPQPLFAKALRELLSRDAAIEVVGDAARIDAASARTSRPDLILLDLDGGEDDIVEAVNRARSVLPLVRICVLSMHIRTEAVQRALSAGADGFLVKDITPTEFVRAIKVVGSGDAYVDPRASGAILRRRATAVHDSDRSELSMRETEVIRLIVAGKSNKEIGSTLCLSEKTIKNHVSRIFSKLNCGARTQAAVYALREGIV